MIFKTQYFTPFLSIITLIFLSACQQNRTDKNVAQTDNITSDNQALTIDTFSTFPPAIEGCSCYFANDSNEFKEGEYIYMNDYDQASFLKINGVLTKFMQTDSKEVDKTTTIVKAKSDQYEIIIESEEGKQNGDETWLKTGTIKLIDKKGKTTIRTFYGECGC